MLKQLQVKVNAQARKEELMHQHMEEMIGHNAESTAEAGGEHKH